MRLLKNVSLKEHSTMRLGGRASNLAEIFNKTDLVEAIDWAEQEGKPIIMIGEGSNIVWKDSGFQGLLIVNKLSGVEQVSEDDSFVTFEIAAGEFWDTVVEKITSMGLSGIECLSLIPGTTGATPIQNVGAYGQEISNVLISVEAYDANEKKFVLIDNKDCGFAYRTSRFKTSDKGRFFITGITLRLNKAQLTPPFYLSLDSYLKRHNITTHDPLTIREAVVAIRSDKLPDWHKVANNGSFFGNPIISGAVFEKLKTDNPDIVAWDYGGQHKISAGWLVENVGFRGYHDGETGMATSEKQAIVLINEHAHSTADLLKFKQKIVDAVKEKFGITLEQEPELLP